jgi:hypothetical protein
MLSLLFFKEVNDEAPRIMPINHDDKNNSLCHEESIISQIVDIGNEQNQEKYFKLRYYIKNLQCLQPKNTQLHRVAINAFDEREYLALSYTWERSDYEDDKKGRFLVEGWDEKHLKSSDVRDCVFDRILKYMRYKNVQLLWIDKHSIPQDTCETVCTIHDRCIQKRDALQVMDLVYKLSKHPVGLLGRPMKSKSELNLLECLLSGKLVDGSSDFRVSTETTIHKAKKALGLLHDITQDRWWQRAWTFQENYRGGRRMRLLIRHNPSLERRKLRLGGLVRSRANSACRPPLSRKRQHESALHSEKCYRWMMSVSVTCFGRPGGMRSCWKGRAQ